MFRVAQLVGEAVQLANETVGKALAVDQDQRRLLDSARRPDRQWPARSSS